VSDLDLEIVRRIRGNVHGTVDITALEDRVIDHPMVQRLRRIKQLAFLSLVFPGATHTRFEHSLGVMQLTGLTWSKMRSNQQRLAQSCGRYRDFAAIERRGAQAGSQSLVHGLLAPTFPMIEAIFGSAYTLQTVRLAALLHDLGHPPFSHSGERFLPSWKAMLTANRDKIPPYLREYLEESCLNIAASGQDPAAKSVRHEVYTLLLVDKLLTEINQSYQGSLKIDPRDVVSVINPAIAPAPNSPLLKHGVYRLCHELISGEVDTDRMDYLLRDSRECGVVYGIFDATRIQESLSIYYDERDQGVHMAINLSGLAAFEDYLRARHSMYLQLYFHKTSVAAEAMLAHLARMLGGWTMPTDLTAYAELDEYNIEPCLSAAAAGLPTAERARFDELLAQLLRNRRLWKRVFEITGKDRSAGEHATEAACELLAREGIPFEQVSSESSLTTFRTRRENELSHNYLRLIKKDDQQFPRVFAIEDYASPSLISGDTRVHISRIYVEDQRLASGQQLPEQVKQLIRERI
jgi:HD superfamily phosphohydrolase